MAGDCRTNRRKQQRKKTMKTKMCLFTGVCAAALAAVGARAQTQIQPGQGSYTTTTQMYIWPGYTGPPPEQPLDGYFNMEFGGLLQQDVSLRSSGQKVSFDPGAAGNFNFGFDITSSLALELQTGFSYNSINTSGTGTAFGGNFADIYQYPLIANVIFRAPLPGGLTPYVGAGYGGMFTELEQYSRGFYASDTDITPAYQVLAGLKCAFNRHTELGVGYRFVATTAHTWFADDPFRYTATGSTMAHYIMATFTFSF
jgi:opacity protein-like surface antigen